LLDSLNHKNPNGRKRLESGLHDFTLTGVPHNRLVAWIQMATRSEKASAATGEGSLLSNQALRFIRDSNSSNQTGSFQEYLGRILEKTLVKNFTMRQLLHRFR
jgi:hypothetical protein